MNIIQEDRYPYSKILFRFCKKALQQKYKEGIKIIDQDVGSILGYDPAECSHWKKGKKNVQNLKALHNISQHLKIDFDLVKKIAIGALTLEEAEFELNGYEHFKHQAVELESIRKIYFQNNDWTKNHNKTNFREKLNSSHDFIFDLTKKFHQEEKTEQINIKTIISNFSDYMEFKQSFFIEKEYQITETVHVNNFYTKFHYKSDPIPNFVRFLALKTLYKTLLKVSHPWFSELAPAPKETTEIYSSLFAGVLLVPKELLTKVHVENSKTSDLIEILANKFKVSKILMSEMIRYYGNYDTESCQN